MNSTPATTIWCAIASMPVSACHAMLRSPLYSRLPLHQICAAGSSSATEALTEQSAGMSCDAVMHPGGIWLCQIASRHGQANRLGFVAGPAQERQAELSFSRSDVQLCFCALISAAVESHWAGTVATFSVPCLTRSMGTLMLLLFRSIAFKAFRDASESRTDEHLCELSTSAVAPEVADGDFIDMSHACLHADCNRRGVLLQCSLAAVQTLKVWPVC